MHLLLTDRLTCPRCGPPFGLILLAERVDDRRVMDGHLGCPNCREHYPVRKGYGDLRSPVDRRARSDVPPEETDCPPVPDEAVASDVEGALRLAALFGVERGPGFLLLMGPSARLAGRLAAMVGEIEVVAVGPGLQAMDERPGVSRMAFPKEMPFHDATFHGVALQGAWISPHLAEALRVVRPGARLVLLDPTDTDRTRLEEAGLEFLLVTGKAMVAVA